MFVQLVVPVLYLASLTQRSSFDILADDIFNFTRNRYFIGENVEVNTAEDNWYVQLSL
jgi:bromodomain adjacent to zinc finger domain protein 1A